MGETFGKSGKIGRVGLISPCSGNLGNAAILSSMIANLRLRILDAEIIGITLSPEDTSFRHGIKSFPITGKSHGSYHLADSSGWPQMSGAVGGRPAYVKRKLKKIEWLRTLVRKLRSARLEWAHIVRSGQLVKTLDQIVVAGGGALDDFWGGPWGHPWTLVKFAVLSRICRVPFLFVSVGMCSLDHRLSRRFVAWALRLSQYRSYRDHQSQADVKAMFPRLSGIVYPDLAYGYYLPDLPSVRKDGSDNKQLRIAVSPIAFCDPRVWPVKDMLRYSRYVAQLARFVKGTIRDGYKLILFATDGPDVDTICDLMKILAADSVDTGKIEVLPGPPQQTTEKLLHSISGVDIVVASRLHGVILSHLISIPVVAISYDRKVDTHMSEIGQSEYCINIDNFTAEMLTERLTTLGDARELESNRLRRAVELNREKTSAQYDLLFGARQSDSVFRQSSDHLLKQVRR